MKWHRNEWHFKWSVISLTILSAKKVVFAFDLRKIPVSEPILRQSMAERSPLDRQKCANHPLCVRQDWHQGCERQLPAIKSLFVSQFWCIPDLNINIQTISEFCESVCEVRNEWQQCFRLSPYLVCCVWPESTARDCCRALEVNSRRSTDCPVWALAIGSRREESPIVWKTFCRRISYRVLLVAPEEVRVEIFAGMSTLLALITFDYLPIIFDNFLTVYFYCKFSL